MGPQAAQERKHEIRERMAELGRRSAEARRGGIVLTPEEAEAVFTAYALLRPIAERARRKLVRATAVHEEEEEA